MKKNETNDIFPIINSNQNTQYMNAIQKRNEVIDDYINNLGKKQMDESSSLSENEDPFSAKSIQKLKKVEKNTKNIKLPDFHLQRQKLKSEQTARANKLALGNINSQNNQVISIFTNYDKSEEIKKTSESTNENLTKIKSEDSIGYKTRYNKTNKNINNRFIGNNYKNINNAFSQNVSENKWIAINGFGKLNTNPYRNVQPSLNNIKNKQKLRSKSHCEKKLINKNYYGSNTEVSEKSNKNKTNYSPYLKFNNLYAQNILPAKKRNYTAKNIKKYNVNNMYQDNNLKNLIRKQRVYSTFNPKKIIESKHLVYEKLVNEKNNPYGLDWANRLLSKNSNEIISVSKNGFINGVPIIKFENKNYLSKKELKKKLNEISKQKKLSNKQNSTKKLTNSKDDFIDDDFILPNEVLKQFTTNSKNFFKARKDIIEEPEEEETGNN